MVLTGFTVGFALFYEVGFVLMLPLVFTIAASANIPLLYVGVPMAAALSVTHGFLPPHPGPTAIATIFNADMGKTLLYGTILAIPTVILAGPVYARVLKGIDKPIPEGLYSAKTFSEEEMPSFGVSVWTSLVPVVLMAMRAIAEMILPKGHAFLPVAEFLGDPVMATLIAVLIAMFTFGLNRGRSMDQINDTLVSSIKIIAMMLLIIGGGGAFKQVLVDSGVDKYIASMMHETNISPLLMARSIAAVLRIALGSATVAAITAGGIAAPLIATTGVSPELMVIAVGSGSVIFSHVNDPGFWLFKEYFNLTIGETIKSSVDAGNHYLGVRSGRLSAAEYGDLITLTAGCIASGINRTLLLLRCSSAPSVQILQQLVHAIIGKHRLKRCGKLASPVFILVTGAVNIHRFGHIQPVFRL